MAEASNFTKLKQQEEVNSKKEENLNQNLSPGIRATNEYDGKNNKRDSIKFLRKIIKLGMQKLKFASFPTAHFEYFVEVLLLMIKSFEIKINDHKSFIFQNKEIFRKVWAEYKGLLSFRKNPKLSLLTSEEWESFFTKKGFEKRLGKNSEDFDRLLKAITLKSQDDRWLFISLYCKLAFVLNTVLVQSIIHIELQSDKSFLESIKSINELVLLTQSPILYKHFNHSKGKFAKECCNRCKICCSSTIPKNYSELLKVARENQQKFEALFKSLKTRESGIMNKEIIMNIFSFCGLFSMI